MNFEGLKRRGYSKEALRALRHAYKVVYREGKTIQDALTELSELNPIGAEVQVFIDSIRNSRRGISR